MRIDEPPEWDEKQLRELVSFEKGRVVTTQPYETTGALPYIGAENFGGAFTLYTTEPIAVVCEPSDILMLWDGERSGLCSKNLQGAIGSTVARLRPLDTVDGGYLYHQLTRFFPWIQARRTGTGVPHVTKDLGGILWLPVPKDEEEQRRIAAVLDTVDEAIAKTEALIVKLKQIRTGLIHDLLTRGLDENGQIRNPITQPEQFKDSSVGPIPKSWRSRSLWELVPIAEYGISSPLYDSGKTPVLRMNNLSDGEASLTDLRFTNAEIPEDLILRPNDVLFNRTNSMVHVGRTGIWRGQIEHASFASYLVRLSPNPDLLTPEYLNLLLNLPETQIKMRRFATPAVQQVNINPTNLRKIVVAVPDDLQEQILVVDRISDVSENIRQRQIILTKLQSLKHGLMSDLLSGRVRVTEGII